MENKLEEHINRFLVHPSAQILHFIETLFKNFSASGSRDRHCLILMGTVYFTSAAQREIRRSIPLADSSLLTCNVGVLEQQQKSIAESGARGLCTSREEWENSDDEVPLVEFSIGVSLVLHVWKNLSWVSL